MQVHLVNENIRARVTPQSLVRLDRGGLPPILGMGSLPITEGLRAEYQGLSGKSSVVEFLLAVEKHSKVLN